MTADEPGDGGGFSWGLTPSGNTPERTPERIPESRPALPDSPAPADPEATQLVPQLPPAAEQAAAQPAAAAARPAAARPAEPGPAERGPAEPGPAEPAPAASAPVRAAAPAAVPGSALDSLFGEAQFREYEPGLVATEGPLANRAAASGASGVGPRRGLSRGQKAVLGVVGGLLAVLALVGLFLLGTRLPKLIGAAPAVATSSATPSATPTPTPTARAVGPVAPGVHRWDQLLGGECLSPYTSPWVESFTVVDCGTPHPAQMVFRGTFAATADPAFPGAAALQTQISLLCAVPGVLDLAAAGQYSDAQVQGSYPVTSAQWDAGEHDYFCFISRSSGQPLTGSVAAAKAP